VREPRIIRGRSRPAAGMILRLAVILVLAIGLALPIPATAKSYRRVDKISSSVKSDPRSRSLTKSVDSFYRLLQDKDRGGLYDFLPVVYTVGVSRDEFVCGAGAQAISGAVFPELPEITGYEIKNVAFVGDERARVEVVLSVFDMLDGVKTQSQECLWIKEHKVWGCPEWYRRLLNRFKQPVGKADNGADRGTFEQEMKKEILKDEVYDFIRSD